MKSFEIEEEKPKRNWLPYLVLIILFVMIMSYFYVKSGYELELPPTGMEWAMKEVEGGRKICEGFENSTFLVNETDNGTILFECIVERFAT